MPKKNRKTQDVHLDRYTYMKLQLHLGAHKTATTHLQNLLSHCVDQMAPQTGYASTDEVRQNFHLANHLSPPEHSRAYFTELSNRSYQTLIVSEENICGHTAHCFQENKLYAKLPQRLSTISYFKEIFDDIEIWFSIRRQADFIPSLYCEALRWRRFQPFSDTFDGIHKQSWMPTLNALKTFFPDSKVNVLLYDHYQANVPMIMRRMAGLDDLPPLDPQAVVNTSVKGASVTATKWLNHLAFGLTPRGTINKVDKLIRPFVSARFQPYSVGQLEVLEELYLSDIKRIKQNSGLTTTGRGWDMMDARRVS